MSVIKQMDEKLANMIAAGEVVERPASIIKELVENSIDAKASEIIINVTDNGLKEIIVTDNGVGMTHEDAKMAFLRHATSKINNEYDLERIKTLGFRGEALAAIVSVSKVRLETRQENSNAIYVTFLDSKLIEEGHTSLNVGTSIKVSNLFYNTPARLKYLKSEFSERAAIIDTFDRLALSNPNIRFQLIIDDKLIKETYGDSDYYSLISQIYGPTILKDLKYFEKEFSKIKLKGYLASPTMPRSRRKDISIFVNGRYIKNYSLTQAVIDGYHSFLMTNKYPLAVLIIEMDPVLLDVNVHPQKLEVKFSNESILKFQIENYIKETLTSFKQEIPQNFSIIEKKNTHENETFVKEQLQFEENEYIPYEAEPINSNSPFTIQEDEVSINKIPEMEYVGTLAGTYLLFQNEKGMYMIDQHAAEERINYEYYFDFLGNPEIIVQKMFIERPLNLTTNDLEQLKENEKLFNEIGFYFNDKLSLVSHPTFILDKDIENTINDLLIMINDKGKIDLKMLLDNLAKDKSCKASIRANDKISRKEIDELLKKLRLAKNPYTCPHGRPTIILLTHYEIERMFKRIVS